MLLFWAIVAILLGGVLKGAVGAGVPVIAAPALTMLYDVKTAVALLVVQNVLSNVWQSWTFRKQALSPRFLVLFSGAGVLGVVSGTLLLAWLPPEILSLMVALATFGYIGLRVAKSGWVLSRALGERLAALAGFLGGMLQGAIGISAPASISFLNAMRLTRAEFIGTISVFFITISVMQIPALFAVGILTPPLFVIGFLVFGVVSLAMPVGTWLGKRLSAAFFDRLILLVLAVIAGKIVVELTLKALG